MSQLSNEQEQPEVSAWDRPDQVPAGEAKRARQDRLASEIAPNRSAVLAAQSKYPGAQPVVIVDFQMSFGAMVVFMVKAAIAAIPASIILYLAFLLAGRAIGMLLGI